MKKLNIIFHKSIHRFIKPLTKLLVMRFRTLICILLLLAAMKQQCDADVIVVGNFDNYPMVDLFKEGKTSLKDAKLTPPGEGYPFKSETPHRALRFKSSSRFDLPISCFPFESGTLTMWVKPRDITRSHKLLSCYGSKGRGYFLYYRKMRDGYWIFLDVYFRGRSKTYKAGSFQLKKNEWVYVGFSWDVGKKQIALYHNGQELLKEDNVELHRGIRKRCFNIGYYDHKSAGTDSGAICDFDELVIEDNVVSPEDVSQRYRSMSTGEPQKYKVSGKVLEAQLALAGSVIDEAEGLLRASQQVNFKGLKFSSLSNLKEFVKKLKKQGRFDINGELEQKFFTTLNKVKSNISKLKKEIIDHIVKMPPVRLPDSIAWLPTMRVASHLPVGKDKSPHEIARAVLEFFLAGVNNLNTIKFGTQFTWNPKKPHHRKVQVAFPPKLEYGKLVTEMCHKLGIRVTLHTTIGYVDRRVRDFHPEWLAVDIRNNKISEISSTPPWNQYLPLNYNHKGWRKHLFKNLREAMQVTGADGIMPDEIHWSNTYEDASLTTRKLFKKETGLELPNPNKKSEWMNWNSSVWRAWIDSRRHWNADFIADLKRQVIDPLRRKIAYMTCVTGSTKPWRYETGVDNSKQAKAGMNVNFMEAECSPTHIRKRYAYATYWPRYYREMKALSGISNHYGSIPLTYAYPETHNEQFFVWTLAKTMGHAYWVDFPMLPKGMFEWERKHEDILKHSAPYADVAIVFSQENNFLYGNRNEKWKYHYEFAGWCETLAEGHIPYVVLLDEDLDKNGILFKYKTLILPNTAIISDKAVENIKKYVKSGGQIIATFQTGTHSAGGQLRKKAAFSDLFKITLEKPGNMNINLASAAKLFKDKQFKKVSFNAETAVGKSLVSKSLIVNSYGKGRAMYLCWRAGYRHRFPGKYGKSKVFIDKRNPVEGKLLTAAVKFMHPEKWLWAVENLPRNVFINGFKQKKRRIIHIVNAIGGEKKHGQEITPGQRVSYPLIGKYNGNKNLVLKVSEPIASANIISPDFDQPVKLKVKQKNAISIITIPVAKVKRYSIIVANIK